MNRINIQDQFLNLVRRDKLKVTVDNHSKQVASVCVSTQISPLDSDGRNTSPAVAVIA